MVFSPKQWLKLSARVLLVGFAIFTFVTAAMSQAQSSAADLQGVVHDPNGAVVTKATVTTRNTATNVSREATTNDDGFYKIVNLTPGEYEITVSVSGYKTAVIQAVHLTVGQTANQDISLEVGDVTARVTVTTAAPNVVETTNTALSSTIDRQRIENLPINERNYLSFALTSSMVGRDNGRPIGPAPTSGLNFGGQRGRSNLVQVDGADNTDNSVNAARSTVSQEAVQEFQVVTNSFAPEFGRSSGGVVNVVTKSGTNDWRGNLFGFLRHKSFQARNPFAPITKPPFTRAQYGATLGGPLLKDRTFIFVSFEQRQRHESGFFTSNVSQGLTGSVTLPPLAPGFPSQTLRNVTPAQAAYINGLLANSATAPLGIAYAYLASGGGSTALTGFNPLLATGAPFTPGTVIGSRFFLSGAPIPSSTANSQAQLIEFRHLQSLQTVFPVTDKTTFNSFRLDHLITKEHHLSFRFGYNPSTITGIQVESQNQSLGQNDFSRTGIQKLKDYSAVVTLASTLSSKMVNELRFNFGVRRALFKSQNGDAVAFNISGTAFIGRELFSPVIRTETRYEWTDNINILVGNHTFKFGGDYAAVNIPSAVFELNFAGLFNFGGLGACNLVIQLCSTPGLPTPPDFTPVQQYGLGFPINFIQGFGNPVSRIDNKPMAWFAQDSWKIRRNLTFNYGVRYDYEKPAQVPPVGVRDPLSGINLSAADVLAAQDAVNVQQGFPPDRNNFAPRLGIAWDIKGDAKTVVRAAAGMFYDHPLLAIAFNSDIADAAQQQQGILTPGSPDPRSLVNAVQVFQGTVVECNFTGAIPGVNCTPGVAPSAQYQTGRQRFNDQTFPGFGPVLPFTVPVNKDFKYAYANQANLTIERQLTQNMSISAGYLFVGAHHLPHPLDLNAPRTDLQIQNFVRCFNRQPVSTTEVLTLSPSACSNIVAQPIPGIISVTTRGGVIQPAVANFFRPNAPNYFLVQALTGGVVTPAVFNGVLAASGTLRTPGVVSPFGSVNAQSSDGNSNYNAMNLDLKKRF